MENTIYRLEDLFCTNVFRIPQYQRAYSWNHVHLAAFLEDLRQQISAQAQDPQKQYFLGTLLLHEINTENQTVIHIVDGQQRLTTSVVFIATALHLADTGRIPFSREKPNVLRRNFIYDADDERRKFHTIDEDEPFFRAEILKLSSTSVTGTSPSALRLKAAADFFANEIKPEELEPLVNALRNSRVMVYAVSNAADATQIFELQNDRGKKLSDLEALKSFLMHTIYLNAKCPEDQLGEIQVKFANIFRLIEELAGISRAPNEDSVLAYHCVAYLDWISPEWRNPKQLIKNTIKSLPTASRVDWITDFTSELVETYRTVRDLFSRRDTFVEFSELVVLGRMAPFWPGIIKACRLDSSEGKWEFRKICRLMEVYSFKGYAMCNLRSDSGMASLYTVARKFIGNFQQMADHISSMCSWNNLDARYASGLDNPSLFVDDKNDTLYLLWKYENYLRQQRGRQQPLVSWQDFVEPRNYASKLSIEHIAAVDNPIAGTQVQWEEDVSGLFRDLATHRLGNLVIDAVSPNAAKGKKDFSGKLKKLSEESIFLSQGELIRFAETVDGQPAWTVNSVKIRHRTLFDFALKTWTPEAYHLRTVTNSPSDDFLVGEEISEDNLVGE